MSLLNIQVIEGSGPCQECSKSACCSFITASRN